MNQRKSNIRTIFEVLTYLLIYFSISFIDNPLISIFSLGLWVAFWIYNLYKKVQYRNGIKLNIVIFPTLNDDYSKMTSITLGIMIIAGSLIGYFAFSILILYCIIGSTVGIIIFLNGVLDLPKGWIIIENNLFRINSIEEEIDLKLLKEIIVKNDQITLTNQLGEHKNVNLLNLDSASGENIKRYITERLNHNTISIINNVQ
ncbi:MAG TPA: hypothetical protein VK668_06120 [Mucilaginibacter sp.]|nr:hypothetical protein [Mucilaginibacter sp.]